RGDCAWLPRAAPGQAAHVADRGPPGTHPDGWHPRRPSPRRRAPRGHPPRAGGAADAVSRLAGPARSPFATLRFYRDQAAASAGHGVERVRLTLPDFVSRLTRWHVCTLARGVCGRAFAWSGADPHRETCQHDEFAYGYRSGTDGNHPAGWPTDPA